MPTINIYEQDKTHAQVSIKKCYSLEAKSVLFVIEASKAFQNTTKQTVFVAIGSF